MHLDRERPAALLAPRERGELTRADRPPSRRHRRLPGERFLPVRRAPAGLVAVLRAVPIPAGSYQGHETRDLRPARSGTDTARNERCHWARVSAAPSSPPGVARPYDTLCAPVETCATASSGGNVAAYASHISAAARCGSTSHHAAAMRRLLDGQPAVSGREQRRCPRLPRRGGHAALPLRWLPAA